MDVTGSAPRPEREQEKRALCAAPPGLHGADGGICSPVTFWGTFWGGRERKTEGDLGGQEARGGMQLVWRLMESSWPAPVTLEPPGGPFTEACKVSHKC